MRDKGVPDREIAATLTEQGLTNYSVKTINSRYIRIKAALAARLDQRLDDELTDWHEGEVCRANSHRVCHANKQHQDEMLLAATETADAIIEKETEKLKARRWQYVAKHLGELKPSTNYSPTACRKRFQALMSDTAKIPPELDDDPEKRAGEKAERLLAWIEKQNALKAAEFEATERARKAEEQDALTRATKRLDEMRRRREREAKRSERINKQAAKQAEQQAKALISHERAQRKMEQLLNVKNRKDNDANLLREEQQRFNAQDRAMKTELSKDRRDSIVANSLAKVNSRRASIRKTIGTRSESRSSTPVDETASSPPNRRRSNRGAASAASNKIYKSAKRVDDEGAEEREEDLDDSEDDYKDE